MLALRPLIAVIAVVLVPLMSVYLLLEAETLSWWRVGAVAAFTLVSFGLFRNAVLTPLYALRRWRAFARERGFTFRGDLSHEPVVTGELEGRRFVAGISAHISQPGAEERYRTIVSSPVEVGVPLGLRVYSKTTPMWLHEHSGKRELATGDEALEGEFHVEGVDAGHVRDFVTGGRRRRLLLDFVERHQGLLVHGKENDVIPAEPGGASGVVTLGVPGRVLDGVELMRYIEDVVGLAKGLEHAPDGD